MALWVWDIAPSPDGRKIALALGPYAQGGVELRDKASGALLWRGEHPDGQAHMLAFSPDGRHLASGGFNRRGKVPGEVRLWDVASGKLLRTFAIHTGRVYSLAFSPDGKTVAAGSGDGRIRLWNSATGKVDKTLLAGGAVTSVAFSPDGALLASGGWRSKVLLWNVKAGELWGQLQNKDREAYAVVFSPDGKKLATAPALSLYNVREKRLLWTTTDSYNFRPSWETHNGSLVFSPAGDVVAISGLSDAGVYQTADGTKIREFKMAMNLVISKQNEIFALEGDASHSTLVQLDAAAPDNNNFK